MSVVCPTVTATDLHEYRRQVELIGPFAGRIHFDFMDGIFTPTHSPELIHAWWPDGVQVDMHIMYKYPLDHLETIIHLKPQLVIVHAEAEGNFLQFAQELHEHGIKVGVAVLPETELVAIKPALKHIDHVLVFSGKLGFHGGIANLDLLNRVRTLRHWKPNLEIGWDGGINADNAQRLIDAGVDVLNVGGAIHRAQSPGETFATLQALASKS